MTGRARPAPRVRLPTLEDAPIIGMLVSSALHDAPSAPLDADELGDDLEQVGRDFVSAMTFGNETLLFAELGRHAAGIARPVLQALVTGGRDGAVRLLAQVEAEIRAVMLLVGAGSVRALRKAPYLLTGDLPRWADLAKTPRKAE